MSESKEDLNLIRTDLASERTLLAYGRTALMVGGSGVTLIKLFPESITLVPLSWSLIVIGGLCGSVGVSRFFKLRGRLHP